MPSFDELLRDSMPFAAAHRGGLSRILGDFEAPAPSPVNDNGDDMPSEECVLRNRIWQFDAPEHQPATFKNVRLWSRGMGMNYGHSVSVLREIEFSNLVVHRACGPALHLPLTSEFVVERWSVGGGSIPESDIGLWQLAAMTDWSVLVAFVWEESNGALVPMNKADIDALGAAFMPSSSLPPLGLDMLATDDMTARVCIGNSRYVALISLTTCRERSDFAPGDIIGFARFYPHAMVMANEALANVEVSIRLERPSKAMTHGGPEMEDENKALLVTDSNQKRSVGRFIHGIAIPLTSNIYDYYLVDPDQALGQNGLPTEVTLADRRQTSHRTRSACVGREGNALGPITKWPRQGQFDNVHLAPRMRLKFPEVGTESGRLEIVSLEQIAMVFICLHDCVHLHARWASYANDKPTCGFKNGVPYSAAGAPAVPENQIVRASFPTSHSLVYRADAAECREGTWQVFFHHGAAYAIDAWPGRTAELKRVALRSIVEDVADTVFPSMPKGWPGFYWRCRFTQDPTSPGRPLERLRFDIADVIE